MLCQDQALHAQETADQKRHATIVRTGTHIARKSRFICFKGGILVATLVLGLALLASGCAASTGDETPTSAPDVGPSATLPIATSSPQQTEPQDEAPSPMPTVSGPTVLRTDPSVVNLVVGETYLVQVWLDNVAQLRSIELHIGFEPRYVRIEDADPNTAGVQIEAGAIPVPAQVMRNEVDNGAGLIIYQVAQALESPASGSGMVASFTARALAEGGSPLRFSVVTLKGPEGQQLPAPEQVDGLVVIGAGGTTAVPTAVAPPTVPTTPVSTEDVYHTVQPGENLFRIALRYGTTVDAIIAANNLSDAEAVQAGQVLRIPAGSPAGTGDYVVQPGDTLYSIARRFDTTVETLAALNGIASPYAIEVGQVLIVTP